MDQNPKYKSHDIEYGNGFLDNDNKSKRNKRKM